MKLRHKRRPTANRRKGGSVLRMDPSRTAGLRRAFAAELFRRFARLRFNVVKYVGQTNAFGLVANRDFAFVEDSRKLEEFRLWLERELGIVGLTGEELFRRYAEAGYRKGAGRAFDDARKAERAAAIGDAAKLDFYAGTREEFLRSAFGRPVAIEKVKHLASRAFSDLKGVTDAMSATMARALSDGLVQGKGPREVARQLAKDVDWIGRKRAVLIARTELIRSHAEGALDAFEQLGIEEVGALVEFLATDDDLVCPECDALSGVVFSIDEARGIIPVHPLCRCAWTAHVPSSKKAVTQNTKFPELHQSKSWDCGSECFRGVLWTYGIKKSESEVIRLLGTTPTDGTRFGRMAAVGREFGLQAVEFADNPDAAKLRHHIEQGHQVICPVQKHDGGYDAKDMTRQEGHYVVALECDEDTVTFADPASGRKTVRWPEFVKRWHDQAGEGGYVRSGLAFAGVTTNANPNHDERGRFASKGAETKANKEYVKRVNGHVESRPDDPRFHDKERQAVEEKIAGMLKGQKTKQGTDKYEPGEVSHTYDPKQGITAIWHGSEIAAVVSGTGDSVHVNGSREDSEGMKVAPSHPEDDFRLRHEIGLKVPKEQRQQIQREKLAARKADKEGDRSQRESQRKADSEWAARNAWEEFEPEGGWTE